MSPEGSETKCKKEMTKQPLTLTIKIESADHIGVEAIHCVIAKRIRLPIPPPAATKKYLLIRTVSLPISAGQVCAEARVDSERPALAQA